MTLDAVRYNDREPWPPEPMAVACLFAAHAGVWFWQRADELDRRRPTPGQAIGAGDSDYDGLPDAWEQANALVFIPDANDDPDHDGLTNWEEYLAGTHPNDATSALRFTQISSQNGNVVLQFLASSNRTYSLLYKPELGARRGRS